MRSQILRQIFITSTLFICCFTEGFIFGQMSGMIDDLRTSNSTLKISDDEISWIASIMNILCFCAFGLITIINELLGRGKIMCISIIPVIISWIMVYFANNKIILIISRITAGLSYGGIGLISYVCIGEYVSPKVRALCLNIAIAVGMNSGTMVGHVLCTFMHWRNVALIALGPSILSGILPLLWVESPSWLAIRGRLEESKIAFRSLHVASDATDIELKLLLINHKERLRESGNSFRVLARKTFELTKAVYFRKLCLLLFILMTYRTVLGKIFFSTFAITIIQDVTKSDSITNFTLFVDGFMLVGTAISCLLVSAFQLKYLVITSGIIANVIQVILAACLYIWQDRYDYVIWIKVALLALYFIIVNAGPYAVIETLISEIFPLDVKAFMMMMTAIACGVMQFLSIKLAPSMFVIIGYHGVFLVHAFIAFCCLFYLYLFLPETKGRTLQEIESYFKYNTFEVSKEVTDCLDKN